MDTKTGYGSILALAVALSIGGCNSDWTDRVPEVAAEPSSESKASPDGQAGAIPDVKAQSAESASDAALSSKVESALKSEPDLHGSAISVRSQEGVVTLSGTAKDPQLRSMAAQVALSIEGVKLVRNEIALGQEA